MSFARHVRSSVDEQLTQFLGKKLAQAFAYGRDVGAMANAVHDLTMRGGKRLRPALLVAGYHACTAEEAPEGLWNACLALELLQTYLLIHDDWMDNDDIRRGGPSVHVQLGQHFGSTVKGNSSAILAGDYASALAQEALATADVPPARVMRSMVCFSAIQQDAVYGQQLDLSGMGDVERMHDLKTGSYTVRGPLHLGAVFADASQEQIAALDAYADPLGVAFQLRDDLLGVFGSAEETGKPVGNDIRAGKNTALFMEAMTLSTAAEQRRLRAACGNEKASDDDINEVRAIFERCGARRAVEGRLSVLVDRSLSSLASSPLLIPGITLLKGAALALTVRRV